MLAPLVTELCTDPGTGPGALMRDDMGTGTGIVRRTGELVLAGLNPGCKGRKGSDIVELELDDKSSIPH